ncbi:transglutaminase-like cysteine peptidase [Pseudomonas sp. 39167]|uniref:transglutaminase-like cysteine peptidase n=1 Tax=Pseudomonas sp. 39167 TaxID=2967215 RepID=UPI0023645A44|nr:transglutaminase-like cysteine peptidase [Pseudomonas sp. 39167]MDD2032093.1 transglutaminase-like cysteine peptidase [Pseudomonas sp. 39167]
MAAPFPVPRSLRWLCSALLLAGLMLGGLQADWDFAQISRRAQALYGPLGEGQQRIDAWQQLLATQKQTPELEQLKVVNLFFNKRVRYVEDIDLWRQVDYWETPIQALWKGAGDCEDYATPDAMPLVLDSLIDGILPASQRTDLLPVYSFNAEGLWLPGAKGNKKVGDTKRLSRWQDVLKKMQAEGFPVETTN